MLDVIDTVTGTLEGSADLTVISPGHTDRAATWRQIHVQARQIARALADRGVRHGDRICLQSDTTIETVAALQAIWLCGATPTMLPGAARGSSLDSILADARPRLILTRESVAELSLGPMADVTAPAPRDVAILQYTSGSTSSPRGVAVTHAQLAANLDALATMFSPTGEQISMMSWLPLFHDMGLVGFLCLPMSRGWPLVLQSPQDFAAMPASWLHAISRHRVAASGGPGFAFRLMTRLLTSGTRADLSSLRFLVCGGEPIDAAVMSDFAAAAEPSGFHPRAIVPAYGLAEATLAVCISPPGSGVRLDVVDGDCLDQTGYARPGHSRSLVRLGPPLPGTEIRIVHPRCALPQPERRVGRIEVRGASVTSDGWLDTGDLGYLIDGELVVCGRAKDVLFAAGRNVHPCDVEAVVAGIEGVRPGRVAAFGIPGEKGDRLVVALESGRTEIAAEVSAAVLAESGIGPTDVIILPPGGMPRTSSGKPRRREARRAYMEGAFDEHKRKAP